MTTRQEPRREQARRLQRLIREHEEREAQRRRARFDADIDSLLNRVRTGEVRPAPQRFRSVPVANDSTPLDAALAALLARVENRPPPPPPPPEPPKRAKTDVWWSPHSVLGYRIWELRGNRLHGAWTSWETHRKTAVCLDKKSRAQGPSPHDAAECPRPPCGIYALKGTRMAEGVIRSSLRRPTPITLALGLVSMTGRVFEHEQGYRAQHVEVVALAMLTGSGGKNPTLATIEPDRVAAAFVDPTKARDGWAPWAPDEAIREAVEFLRVHEPVAAG